VLIPGPLLIYILDKSPRRGYSTGPLTVLGHITVEIPLIILILLGLHFIIQSLPAIATLGILGGILLIFLGLKCSLKAGGGKQNPKGFSALNLHPYIGGIVFSTILNPSVAIWWATMGFALLLDAYLTASMPGLVLWSLGHFTADLSWYAIIAYAAWSGRKVILKLRLKLTRIFNLVLIGFGVYFAVKYGIQALQLIFP
jgi:threonine/homoserine/homoserine lactone efflux protein